MFSRITILTALVLLMEVFTEALTPRWTHDGVNQWSFDDPTTNQSLAVIVATDEVVYIAERPCKGIGTTVESFVWRDTMDGGEHHYCDGSTEATPYIPPFLEDTSPFPPELTSALREHNSREGRNREDTPEIQVAIFRK